MAEEYRDGRIGYKIDPNLFPDSRTFRGSFYGPYHYQHALNDASRAERKIKEGKVEDVTSTEWNSLMALGQLRAMGGIKSG